MKIPLGGTGNSIKRFSIILSIGTTILSFAILISFFSVFVSNKLFFTLLEIWFLFEIGVESNLLNIPSSLVSSFINEYL